MNAAGLPSKDLLQRQPVMLANNVLKDLKTHNIRVDREKLQHSVDIDPSKCLYYPKPYKPHNKQYIHTEGRYNNKSLLEKDSLNVKNQAKITRWDNFTKPDVRQSYRFSRVRERNFWKPGRLGPVPGLTKYDLKARKDNKDKSESLKNKEDLNNRWAMDANQNYAAVYRRYPPEINLPEEKTKYEKYCAYPKIYNDPYAR